MFLPFSNEKLLNIGETWKKISIFDQTIYATEMWAEHLEESKFFF